jgi:hypothetical protein
MKRYAKRVKVSGAFALLILLLSFASCKKEIIPPDHKEEPKFYIEAKMNEEDFRIDAGENNYRIIPEATSEPVGSALRVNYFTSTLTNDEDSFVVVIKGREAGSPFDVASDVFLDAALDVKKFRFEAWNTFPGAFIGMKRNGIWYYSYEQQISDAHFTIDKPVEHYQPPGAAHPMRKVEASFKCLLLNPDDLSDQIVIEDGKATLLFTYETK